MYMIGRRVLTFVGVAIACSLLASSAGLTDDSSDIPVDLRMRFPHEPDNPTRFEDCNRLGHARSAISNELMRQFLQCPATLNDIDRRYTSMGAAATPACGKVANWGALNECGARLKNLSCQVRTELGEMHDRCIQRVRDLKGDAFAERRPDRFYYGPSRDLYGSDLNATTMSDLAESWATSALGVAIGNHGSQELIWAYNRTAQVDAGRNFLSKMAVFAKKLDTQSALGLLDATTDYVSGSALHPLSSLLTDMTIYGAKRFNARAWDEVYAQLAEFDERTAPTYSAPAYSAAPSYVSPPYSGSTYGYSPYPSQPSRARGGDSSSSQPAYANPTESTSDYGLGDAILDVLKAVAQRKLEEQQAREQQPQTSGTDRCGRVRGSGSWGDGCDAAEGSVGP